MLYVLSSVSSELFVSQGVQPAISHKEKGRAVIAAETLEATEKGQPAISHKPQMDDAWSAVVFFKKNPSNICLLNML